MESALTINDKKEDSEENGISTQIIVFTKQEVECESTYPDRVYLVSPDNRFKCGDIVRIEYDNKYDNRPSHEKLIIIGCLKRYNDHCSSEHSNEMDLIGVKIPDKNNEFVQNLLDPNNNFQWRNLPEIITRSLNYSGRIRHSGKITDIIPEFHPTEEFFQSANFDTEEIEEFNYALYENLIHYRDIARKNIILLYSIGTQFKDVLFALHDSSYFDQIFSKKNLIEVIKKFNSYFKNDKSFFHAMKFLEQISIIKECRKMPRYTKRPNSYEGYDALDPLSILDALSESGDEQTLNFMLKALGGHIPPQYDWFDYKALYAIDKNIEILQKVAEILHDRAIVNDSSPKIQKKKDFYSNPLFFDTPPAFPEVPLSVLSNENALILEGAIGCPKAAAGDPCKFCTNTLKDTHFKIVEIDAFIRRLNKIQKNIDVEELDSINKIFITGADLLALPKDKVIIMLRLIKQTFRYNFKIEGFANIPSILKNRNDLADMREAGLTLLYIGGECGDDETLASMRKQQTSADIIEACKILKENEINASLFLMPGLGGIAQTDRIAEANANLIRKAQPRFVNILPLTNPPPECIKIMNSIPNNRPMTEIEITKELLTMMALLRDTKAEVWKNVVRVESFDPKVVNKAAITPLVFKAIFGPNRAYPFEKHSKGLEMLHHPSPIQL